jgi:hypothetical protein
LQATAVAITVAGVLLVTAVLPAEYGIDPTGIGAHLGLDVLGSKAQAAELADTPGAQATPPVPAPSPSGTAVSAEATKAAEAFGASPGQSFDTDAVIRRDTTTRRDTMSVTLAPGKGAEIKAMMKSGDGFVFRWTASDDVAVDMHGERTGAAKDEYTSYWIESDQHEAAGSFIAPFDGIHGWYWLNRSTAPVTVEVEVTGFQQKLFRPGHS